MKYAKYYLIALLVILVDQGSKLLVHFNMDMGSQGQIKLIGDFFKLHYLTNPGMAFGMQLSIVENGKLWLTIIRLAAMVLIAVYLYIFAKKGVSKGLLVCVALILGGAIGNVIDSIFYGVWLDNAPYDAPSAWFHGQVIDMFYIDIWEGRVADWVPFWGGEYMALWPVFNVADASIFVGVGIILIMQKRFFGNETKTSLEEESGAQVAEEASLQGTENFMEESAQENSEEEKSQHKPGIS